jgi:hypothetical protein
MGRCQENLRHVLKNSWNRYCWKGLIHRIQELEFFSSFDFIRDFWCMEINYFLIVLLQIFHFRDFVINEWTKKLKIQTFYPNNIRTNIDNFKQITLYFFCVAKNLQNILCIELAHFQTLTQGCLLSVITACFINSYLLLQISLFLCYP